MRQPASALLRQCRSITAASAAVAILAFGAACSDSSGGGGGGGGGGGTTDFLGIMSTDDGLESAEISISLDTGSPDVSGAAAITAFATVNASGTHKLGGTTVNMSGTYDTDPNSGTYRGVTLTGGGWTVAGFFDGADRLEGAFSNGGGKSGTFVTTKKKGGASVAYCGSFTGDDDGSFSFVIDAQGKISGNAYKVTGGAPIPLDGVLNGSNITIYLPGTTGPNLATGTISGSDASGSWDDHQGNTGTWSGSVCP